MNLRAATIHDADLLFRWRNDPVTRLNSRNQDEVPWEKHVQWLANVLANGSRKLYVAENNGVPVGTCRIDEDGEMSWTVAPDQRGKGYGSEMVRQAAEGFSGPLIAEIKCSNLASLSIVRRLGFQQVAEGEMTRWVKPISSPHYAASQD